MTYTELQALYDALGDLRGWDFSRARTERDPAPWDYVEVVARYLRPTRRVLDVATGGGEIFLSLAPHFASGVGIDSSPSMIQTARENTPPVLSDRISFSVMQAQDLAFP